jgi:hypothetical protein
MIIIEKIYNYVKEEDLQIKDQNIYRTYNDISFRRVYAVFLVHRYRNVDFVRSLLVIASKKD